MSLFDSIKGKAQEALRNEELTDKVLDKAEQMATNKFGAENADKIRQAREAVDGRVGSNEPDAVAEEEPAMNPDAPEVAPEVDADPADNPTPEQ